VGELLACAGLVRRRRWRGSRRDCGRRGQAFSLLGLLRRRETVVDAGNVGCGLLGLGYLDRATWIGQRAELGAHPTNVLGRRILCDANGAVEGVGERNRIGH
jgi:hypothetical protein